jgi:hypothetical protein
MIDVLPLSAEHWWNDEQFVAVSDGRIEGRLISTEEEAQVRLQLLRFFVDEA